MNRDASKTAASHLAIWTCCLLGAACSGAPLDPATILAEQPAPTTAPAFIRPATGGVHPIALPAAPAAVPAGEVAPPHAAHGQLEGPAIAVGRSAQPLFQEPTARAFAKSLGDASWDRMDSSDRGAVELVKLGDADCALIGGRLSPSDLQAGLLETPLGVELFGLVTIDQPGLRSLTSQEVRGIFTGALRDWSQLGRGAGPITAIVPADQRTQERAAGALSSGDRFSTRCLRADGEPALASMLTDHPGAIAVTRLTAARRAPAQRVLEIDWTPPSLGAFRRGTYPFGVPLQLITSSVGAGSAAPLFRFARSASGREHLGRHLMMSR